MNASNNYLTIVEKNGKYGFADEKGQITIPVKYDEVEDFKNGVALVGIVDKSEGNEESFKYGFINTSGEVVIPIEYQVDIVNGLYQVEKDGKFGYVDENGKFIFSFDAYDKVGNYNGGFEGKLLRVEKDAKYGFINALGEIVIPVELTSIAYGFDENEDSIMKAEIDGMFCFFNTKGKIVQCLYHEKDVKFKDDKAEINLNGEKFYISKKGERLD